MPNKLNKKAFDFAKSKISKGEYDATSEWKGGPSTEDENKFIEKFGWDEYAKWHLGYDSEIENDETKAKWKYPFTSDFKNVYRSGLVAIRQRASQQNDDEIFEFAGKLIDLIDEKEKSYLNAEITRKNKDYIAVISDNTRDRVGDIVNIEFLDYENYLKNPVVLFNHNSDKVIGKTTALVKENNKLIATFVFASTPFAQEIKTLVDEGILNAMSIGFIPRQIGDGILGGELLEVSIVAIPANPEALILRYLDLKNIIKTKELSDKIEVKKETIEKLDAILRRLARKEQNKIEKIDKLLNKLLGERAILPSKDET